MNGDRMLATIQALLTALFLFAGIYKGVVPSPVDWTILTGGLLCLSLLPQWRLGLELLRHPAIWLFAVLIAYLVVAGWPLSEWGRYKVAESVLLGGPALAAGYFLFRTGAEKRFQVAVLIFAVPSAAAVAIMSLFNRSLHYAINFLSGGYQLPAAMIVFAFFAMTLSVVVKGWPRYLLGGVLSLGLFSTGSTVGTFSALMIAGMVALWTFPPRQIRPVAWLAVIVIPVAIISVAVFPPPSITRLMLKYELLDAQFDAHIDIEGLKQEGRVIIDIDGSQTDVTGRAYLFRSAYEFWHSEPVLGHGFGSIEYAKGYRTPHNVPLEILAEGGLIAFLLSAGMIACAGLPALLQRSPAAAYPLAIFLFTMAAAMVGGYFVGRLQMFAIGAAIATAPTFFATGVSDASGDHDARARSDTRHRQAGR